MKFKFWLESIEDLYGFPEKPTAAPKASDDLPIQAFAYNSLLKYLLRKKIGEVIPRQRFNDQIIWGEKTGALCLDFDANGDVVLRRLVNDLEGNNAWICKGQYRLDIDNYTGKEQIVANDLFKKVHDIAIQPIDNTNRNYRDLNALIKKIAREIKPVLSKLFTFEDIKKVDEKEYIIYFSIQAGGVGRILHANHTAALTPFMHIDISYDKQSGILRIIGNMISIKAEGGFWELGLPFFDEKFVPSQHISEIAQSIIASIKYY